MAIMSAAPAGSCIFPCWALGPSLGSRTVPSGLCLNHQPMLCRKFRCPAWLSCPARSFFLLLCTLWIGDLLRITHNIIGEFCFYNVSLLEAVNITVLLHPRIILPMDTHSCVHPLLGPNSVVQLHRLGVEE